MRLIYDNTHNKDMFYATGIHVPDPFFYLEKDNKRYTFLDKREIDTFKEKSSSDIEAVPLEPFLKKAEEMGGNFSRAGKLALLILREYNPEGEEVEVPSSFPLFLADLLREKGIKLHPVSPFFANRAKKSKEEVSKMRESFKKTLSAFEKIEEILKNSKIEEKKIIFEGKPLTSEELKKEVEKILFFEGMENPEGMVISSGKHSAFPHHPGSGEIKPGSTIVCDIFPKSREHGYFADMTRTYVKGEPSQEIREMYDLVLKAQERALEILRPGITGEEVHKEVCKIFQEAGHEEGFVHGTGHGLGLEVHEDPYLKPNAKNKLEPGNVFSVEPGLYYPEKGGIRIEDVVCVTKDGIENLTNYRKRFLIE